MIRHAAIALMLSLVGVLPASAQETRAAPAAVNAISEAFLTQMKSGRVSEAVHGAFKETEPFMGSTNIDALVANMNGFMNTLGKIQDWKLYRNKFPDTDLVEQTYFVRCANVPFFITIQLYNPGDKWRIIDLQMNTYQNAKTAGYVDK